MKEIYRFTNPPKDQKIKYRKNKNMPNKIGVKMA